MNHNYQFFKISISLILLSLLISSCNSSKTERDTNIEKGEYFLDQLKYKEALELFDLCLKKDSTNLNAIVDKAFCLMDLDDVPGSLKQLKKAYFIDSLSPLVLNSFGRYYLVQGKLEKAEKYCTKAINSNPSYALAYSNLGMIYGMKGNNDLGLIYYNKSIEINPKFWGYYMNRGGILRMIGKYDLALIDLNKAINNDKSLKVQIHSFFLRGMVYRDQMEFNKSIDDFTKSINLKPEYKSLSGFNYYYRGLSYSAIGEYKLALKDLQEAKRFGWTDNIDTLMKEIENLMKSK
jgi:tetratricopeptide (TPR) repeat protein